MDKYIFLDFNGTVLDDVDLCLELLNDLLDRNGNKPHVSLDKYLKIFGFPVIDYYVRAGLDFSIEPFSLMADYFIEEYTNRNVKECHIYDDFLEFVDIMHNAEYKIVLCSASEYKRLHDQLVSFGIDRCFDDVIGLDNYHAKSKLDIAKNYIESNHINPKQLYFIGDTDHDALVGNACGGNVILVSRGHQAREILEKCAARVVDTLKEAASYILNENK